MTRPVAALDRHFPPCGECACCGGPDARHRTWDAIRSRRAAGESAESIALDYWPLTRAAVLAVLRARPHRTKRSL